MAGSDDSHLTPEEAFGRQVAEVRGEASLRAFAKRVGLLSHTAISRIEKGDLHVVGPRTLRVFAEKVGLEVPATAVTQRPGRRARRLAAFCTGPECPDAAIPIAEEGQCAVEPRSFLVSRRRLEEAEAFCDVCGAPLGAVCESCGKPYGHAGGGKCTHCGLAFVPVPYDLYPWLIAQKPKRSAERAERRSRSLIELDE